MVPVKFSLIVLDARWGNKAQAQAQAVQRERLNERTPSTGMRQSELHE
jgi:hypothetical protein